MNATDWLRRFLQPRILLPLLLSAALLVFILQVGDPSQAWADIQQIPLQALALCFGLAFVYLLTKWCEFHILLRGLGIRIRWKRTMLAFAFGEMLMPIPAGIYLQNYLLRRIHGDAFERSAAATSMMLVIEAAITFNLLVTVGIPGWGWLRPAIVGLEAIIILGSVGLTRTPAFRLITVWMARTRFHRAWEMLVTMLRAMRPLARPRMLAPCILLSMAALGALVTVLLVIARGVGLAHMSEFKAATIYFFPLDAIMITGGTLTQLGIVEALGIQAAQAWGYTWNEGLAMLLGFRIIWMASIWIMAGAYALAFRGGLHGRS